MQPYATSGALSRSAPANGLTADASIAQAATVMASMDSRRGNPAIAPEVFADRIKGTFPGDLGVQVTSIEPDETRGRMVVDARHLHPGGYVHGGAWVAFADTVAAWGTIRNLPAGNDFTTIELKTNVFAAAGPGDVLDAVARSSCIAGVARRSGRSGSRRVTASPPSSPAPR